MKSVEDLSQILRRQWENSALREQRLLGAEKAWPLSLSIGLPSPSRIRADFDAVKRHVESWRKVKCGQVIWDAIRYRAMESVVDVPVVWKLNKPSEWIDACCNTSISREFAMLAKLVEKTASVFHSLFVRRRSLWREKSADEIIQAAELAAILEPGIASGRPLRTLSMAGIDTKFFERHEQLLRALLDVRFDGEVSKMGMEAFLGAYVEGDHWLLVMDLDGGLLPFRRQRVCTSELCDVALPGERLLLIENESCQHLLPNLPKAIAVLGAGFDLRWTKKLVGSKKRIAYWGDIDTWGLQFLSQARQIIGMIDVLMMDEGVFERFGDSRVSERVIASGDVPMYLTQSEQILYEKLLCAPRGRLEQEFLPENLVHSCILDWANSR